MQDLTAPLTASTAITDEEGRTPTNSTFLLTQAQKCIGGIHAWKGNPPKSGEKGVMEMAFLDHEQMRILVLDTKNRVVENISRYQGTVNSSVL
jgi:hypothetical protein